MDRRRAAGALLALAAYIATTTAAPTASGNHTALDLYDGHTEGCYYNFRHYAEGDRIMTNEPCLNCTCHNRMLMCYLRVCPFTKAIGQDCTVEKRADQCCPIVTCPDVPVDLLTSTSTSSPAEYGSTGVGKVDNYGCTINGRYLPEGAKVPQTPGKPCEHCYCIRNMTTCVMQECTLHVDGCTPIYAKDVCCPIRYFCDHPDEEMPALDDMTTTVRPTPGFLLTTTATEEPTTMPAKRDCIEDDQLYPDGALIKTEKPCQHCYCMKGDIVCVVQECGTPMENEGKNCTSLPPREGQCCPDTYICEGDEMTTKEPFEEITTIPPRRAGVEGSGYRHDDDLPYTEVPTFEIEGSGEEDISTRKPVPSCIGDLCVPTSEMLEPETETTEANIPQSLSTTSIPILQDIDQETTEPDKGLNTVPSDDKITEPSYVEKTTPSEDTKVTELPTVLSQGEDQSIDSLTEGKTTSHDVKVTESTLVEDSSIPGDNKDEGPKPPFEEPTVQYAEESTKLPYIEPEIVTSEGPVEVTTESIKKDETKSTYEEKTTEPSLVDVKDSTLSNVITEQSSQPTFEEESKTTGLPVTKGTEPSESSEITTEQVTVLREGSTEPTMTAEETTPARTDLEESPEPQATKAPDDEQYITPSKVSDGSTESPVVVTAKPQKELEITTSKVLDESTESAAEVTTPREKLDVTDLLTDTEEPFASTGKEKISTTEPVFKEDAITTEATVQKETEVVAVAITSESPASVETVSPILDHETVPTTGKLPEQQDLEEPSPSKESTTESIMLELSTFAHVTEKETPTTPATETVDVSKTTTLNPEENEIGEELPHLPSPDQIPGEGDCLLNGITYSNNSVVPSTNKCHSGCKCFSSIVKCDPIMCSPPPDYMDNCQVTYDTPDSCCPTYVCDHSKETIPPQPHSQMSGTESPTIASEIECHGNECKISEEKQPPTAPTKIPERCGSDGCTAVEQPAQIPTVEQPEQCSGDNCAYPATTCTDEKCEVPPTKEQPQSCESPEQCKGIKVPESQIVPCDGESCAVDKVETQPCVGEDCEGKPVEVVPQVCVNEEECKESKVPEIDSPPCEGESCILENKLCTEQGDCGQPQQIPCEGEHCQQKPAVPSKDEKIPEAPMPPCEGDLCVPTSGDCADGKCTEVTVQPQTSVQDEVCSDESGCKKPDDETCYDESCRRHEPTDEQPPSECEGSNCVQSVPVVPSDETTPMFVKEPVTEEDHGVPTELPESQTVSDVEVTKIAERDDVTPGPEELLTSVPKVTDLATEQPEPQISEEEQKLPEPTTDGSGIEQEMAEIPTEKYPEPSVTGAPGVEFVTDEIQKETVTPASEYIDKDHTELPISATSTIKDEISQEHVTHALEQETSTNLPEISETTVASDDTRRHEEPELSVTSTPADNEIRTGQPEQPQDEIRTELPESPATSAPQDETPTELPKPVTSMPHDEVRTESSEPVTSTPHDDTHAELPESSVTNVPQDETKTVLPESATMEPQTETASELSEPVTTVPHGEIQTESTEIPVTDVSKIPELPVTNVPQDETPTEQGHDETRTELPEPTITSVPQDEAHTILPESSETSKPEDETHTEPQQEMETATGSPQEGTEVPVSAATSTPFSEKQTKLPESPTTSVSQEQIPTEQPELPVIDVRDGALETKTEESPATSDEAHSELPETEKIPEEEISSMLPEQPATRVPGDELDTEQPEPYKPSAPQDDKPTLLHKPGTTMPQDETHTESPESPITSAAEEERQTETPESSVTSKAQDETISELPESPVTSPQDVTTEIVVKSTEPETENIPESPEVTKAPPTETDTEMLTTKAPKTEAEEPVTSDSEHQGQPESPDELTTQVPKQVKPKEEIDISTMSDLASIPESTESPEPQVTSAPEHETIATEQTPQQPEQETQNKEPSSPAIQDEYITSVPVSITDEDQIQTESPLAMVTKLQAEATTSKSHISEHEEAPTTEQAIKDHEKTETPETEPSETPEPHEESEQSITAKPVLRQPEVIPTESPPQEQEVATESEMTTKEPPAIDKESSTETPVSSVSSTTEPEETSEKVSVTFKTEEPYVPTVPSIQSEEITTKAAEESLITETPEKEVQTIAPEPITAQEPEPLTEIPVSTEEVTRPSKIEEKIEDKETTSTDVASEAPGIPPLDRTTEAQTQDQEKETESPKTSAPEILTEEPEQIATEKPAYETTKAPASEQSIDTMVPEEQTKSPITTLHSHEIEAEHSQEQPTRKPEVLTTEESSMSTPPMKYDTQQEELQTDVPVLLTPVEEESSSREPESSVTDIKTTETIPAEETVPPSEISTKSPISESPEDVTKLSEQPQTFSPEQEVSETTPYLVELEEHTHKIDEELSSAAPSEEPTTSRTELHDTEVPEIGTEASPSDEILTQAPPMATEALSLEEEGLIPSKPETPEDTPEEVTKTPEEATTSLIDKVGYEEAGLITRTQEKEQSTPVTPTETERPFIPEDTSVPEKDITTKPIEVGVETTAPEEEFIPASTKATTIKIETEPTTQSPLFDKFTKPEEKPSEVPAPEPEAPSELQPTDEVPSPEDESHFPPSGGYGQEPDYGEEDQAFGPGTCRYGGKVYVSAQQIPRDDPCDFCFCFRSDIICLQQSCPPPIHGCHEEPIQGFCCPRYECPVAMATTLNVTTTTTTTTTTLPPHFLPHAYKGAAQRRGCQIKGHTYKVGEVVRASSGPCLHCTCGGDGQMKCDPKACTPEPMLRQMIAAAVSAKRRR
ncbi:titin [Hyposmocoma kahamanoa]|uniref:titin n=1 Tax=Hyposmocoma kahamanoa TaxID=1477025 RepID=UPI000E6D5F99|nr:titin [Hyposmocoma kahamanoa]